MSDIALSPTKKCYALMWSYATSCVKCNCCGRFTKSKLKIAKARLGYHKEQLKREEGFNNWLTDDPILYPIQKRNHKASLKSYSRQVAKAKREVQKLTRKKRTSLKVWRKPR